MKKSLAWMLVLVVSISMVLTLSISACKEGVEEPAEEAEEEVTEEVEEEEVAEPIGTILIGALQDLSGPTSVWGNAVKKGLELGVDKINSEGGVNGKKLELIVYDIKLDAQEAITAYNRLVDQDKVVAVAGPPISGIGLALAAVAEEKKVPIVGSFMDPRVTVSEDGVLQNYMFLMQPSTVQYAEILADYALKELGIKKMAVFYDQSNAYVVSLVGPFKEYVENNGGSIDAEEIYKLGDKDFKTQLNKIKEAGVEALFAPNYIQDSVLTVQQADQIGLDITIIGAFDYAPPFASTLSDPELADNIYFANNYSNADPELKELRDIYFEKYNEEPINKVFLGYDKILVIADALKMAGSEEPTAIKDALEKVSNLQCTTGIITISPNTHSPVGLSMVIFRIEKGEYKEIGRYVPESHKAE